VVVVVVVVVVAVVVAVVVEVDDDAGEQLTFLEARNSMPLATW